jgi:hypothetical protein
MSIPRFLPLLFTSDHGVNLGSAFDSGILGLNEKRIPHLTWSSRIRTLGMNGAIPEALGIVHPWVLYRRIHGINPSGIESRDKILYFPVHSSGGSVASGFDDIAGIEFLRNNFQDLSRISVCLTYGDLHSFRRNIFENAGFKVVTVGHPFDRNFVDNFYNLLKRARILVSEGYGSQVAYAVEFGVPVCIIPRRAVELDELNHAPIVNAFENYADFDSRLLEVEDLFGKIVYEVSAEQILFAQSLLGFDFYEETFSTVKIIRKKSFYFIPYWFIKYFLFRNIRNVFTR